MQNELSISKSQAAPQIDDATLGPARYLIGSIKRSLSGIGALLKTPKLLLPTVFMAIMWFALSYLKMYLPASGAVFALSLIFFAQGGMYAGLLGAIGGIIGKAFFAWFVTNALMPVLTGKKAPKSVKMKIGPAFAISDMRGFALFMAGSGIALVIYNFLTGNASLENSVIGLTSMVACLRSLKNPSGFLVGFLRSFTNGRLSRPRAGHCVVGMMLGFALGIGSSFLTTGGLCYTLGGILIAISIVLAVLFRGRRVPAAAMIVMLLMGVMAPALGVAQAEQKWMDPYEAYGVANGDYEALKAAIAKKPFYGAKVEPMGMTFGTYYGIVPNAQEITIVGGSETTIDLEISSPSLEDLHNKTDVYSYLSAKFKGRASFFYDEAALSSEHPYESDQGQNRLPIVARSVGDYSGYEINRSDYGSGAAPLNFNIKGSESAYPVVFDSFESIRESLITDTEYSVYGQQAFDYAPGQLFMVAKLAGGTEIRMSDGGVIQGEMASELHLCVNEIMLDAPSGATEKVSTVWVLDDVIIDNPNEGGGYFHTEVANGRIFESSGGEGSQYNATEYTWTLPPERIELGREDEIQIKKRITWQGDSFTAQCGYMLGRVYITTIPEGESEYKAVYEGYFAAPGKEATSTTLYGNNLDPGQYVESLYTVKRVTSRTGDGPYDDLDSENSRMVIEISAFGSGSVTYVYKLSTEAVYGETAPGGEDGDGLLGGLLEPWEHEWDERADEIETGAIGAASALAGLVGAGAAAAGGFGGPGGPGGFFRTKRKGMDYDPSDGTLVVTSPSGSQEIYRLNPVTGEFESSYGSTLNLGDVDRAREDHRRDLANAAKDRQRMENRTDGDSEYWRKVNRLEHLREKLEREGKGDTDLLSTKMARRLERIQNDIHSGKGLDEKGYRAVRDAYGKYTRGEIGNSRDLPGEYTSWQNTKDMISMSTEEISRGESGKAVALRIVVGMATGGSSEFGFEAARSIYIVKDYVDAGGDSWREAVSRAALQTVVDEGIGRAAGLGLNLVGKAGSFAANMASKTRLGRAAVDGAKNLAGRASNFLGQNVGDLAKKALGSSANKADDAARALKAANAANAIKAANKQLDDAIKASSQQADDAAKALGSKADDAAKSAAKQADDMAKAVGGQTDDAAKAAGSKTDDAAKAADKADDAAKNAGEQADDASKPAGEKPEKPAKPEGPKNPDYEAAEKKWNKQMDEARDEAKKEIDKYKEAAKGKDSAESARDALYRKGQKIGEQKVDNLRRAQERINSNPGSREAQDAYDQALRSVQQDKYAMTKLNSLDGPGANELRGNFNMRNEQFTQATLRNTKERLALEHGVDPSEIKFVEATNSGAGARTADASVTARKVDVSQHTAADFKGASTADDVIPQSARIKGAPMDKDVTARIFDKKTNQWIDLPKEDVERIYRQELYKSHHKGELPKLDGKDLVDDEAISEFAENMDHTVTDRTGKDAYGRGDKDLVNILDKGNKGVKEFEDITSVTGTMEYKSNEWFERADKLREKAAEAGGDAGEEFLVKAEALQGEGVRQLVKQFDAQIAGQVKAVSATGRNIHVSDKLLKSIRVLDQVGKEGGITMAQAEGILKGMGTSVDDVVQQSSSIMESIAKFKG